MPNRNYECRDLGKLSKGFAAQEGLIWFGELAHVFAWDAEGQAGRNSA